MNNYEYGLIQDKGEYILTSGNDLHLEHIIPQKITTKKSKREFGDWETYLGEDSREKHKEYVNRIGNLTLLAKTLNIRASNNPFESKVEEYKKSNIKLTKKISNYKEFKFGQVQERSSKFGDKAVEMWSFNYTE